MNHIINLINYQGKKIFQLSNNFYGKNSNEEISFTNYYMQVNKRPFFSISGECPISRVDESQWEDSILKMKMAGINVIQSCLVWIHHEEIEGVFNFKKSRNLRKFVQLCKKHNMMVILRIGPFIHGEVRNGGLPEWLYGKPFEVRALNKGFLFYTRRWYHALAKQFEGLYFKDDGPIIGIQIDNEYGHSGSPWSFTIGTTNEWVPIGSDGEKYMIELKKMAKEEGLDTPFYTCTGWGGAPTPIKEMLPTNGAYAYWPWLYYNYDGPHPALKEFIYRDYHNNNIPKMYGFEPSYLPEDIPYSCCEMGVGMTCSYKYRFQVDPESGDAIANIKMAGGCNSLGYYIFRGGTNPDSINNMMLNENQNPKKSYDFQASIGEYGQIRPSYHRVKLLHYFAKSYESILCDMGTVLPEDSQMIEPEDVKSLRYCVRTNGNSGFLFLNNYQDHVINEKIQHQDVTIQCKHQTYTFKDLCLDAKEEAVLPFGLDLNGYRLILAKAQPLSILTEEDKTTYFFFSPAGMTTEFLLDGEGIHKINGTEINEKVIQLIAKDEDIQTYEISGEKGNISIVLLSRKRSLDFYEYTIHNKKRAVLCDSYVCFDGKKIRVENPGNNKDYTDILFYPSKKTKTSIQYDIKEGPFCGTRLLWRSNLSKSIPVKYKKVGEHRYELQIPQDFDSSKEILLKIDYEGDVASLFINGKMIADNFWNGATWETGLKIHMDDLKNQSLTLLINPWKKNAKVNASSEMAGFFEEVEESVEKVHHICIQCISEVLI